jgi:hypothetical protein
MIMLWSVPQNTGINRSSLHHTWPLQAKMFTARDEEDMGSDARELFQVGDFK